MEKKLFVKPDEKHVIPLDQAKQWTSSWRKWAAKQGVPYETVLKAFTIPFSDIVNLANFPVDDLMGVRAYLCLSEPDDVSSIKIILVPVDKDNKDILAYPKGAYSNSADESAIFDLTFPCPHLCDPDSELNGD